MDAKLTFQPLTPARWDDVVRLFGPRGACAGCWCMWGGGPAPSIVRGNGDGTSARSTPGRGRAAAGHPGLRGRRARRLVRARSARPTSRGSRSRGCWRRWTTRRSGRSPASSSRGPGAGRGVGALLGGGGRHAGRAAPRPSRATRPTRRSNPRTPSSGPVSPRRSSARASARSRAARRQGKPPDPTDRQADAALSALGPSRGSRMSRSPSPRRFMASTVSMMPSPGKVEIHQASRR